MADSEQAVEMALLILNHEINKVQGVRKVTAVFWTVLVVSVQFVHVFPSQNLDFSGPICTVKSTGK